MKSPQTPLTNYYTRHLFLLLGILAPLLVTPSHAATYFVAKTGSDINPGTLAQPFLTIQRAADLAVAGDEVQIRAGTYRETVVPANSGSSGAPILFKNYNAEQVVVNGCDLVSGWTNHSGAIWRAPMGWTLGDDQIFTDGKMMTLARWPNTGTDISRPVKASMAGVTSAPVTQPSQSSATLSDPALVQSPGFWNGATIHFVPGPMWFQQTGTVSSSSTGSLTFTYLYQPNGGALVSGNPYYLDGIFNALDAPNEWFRDSTGTLYLWLPSNDAPASHIVEAKKRSYAFNLSGKSYVTIKGLQLFASTIVSDNASANNIIDGISASYVTHFSKMPNDAWGTRIKDSGIVISGSSNQLINSRIRYSAGSGVTLLGLQHLVKNNIIQDTDYAAIDNAAITTGNSAFNKNSVSSNHEIANNTISDCGRSGMVLHGLKGGKIHHNEIFNTALQVIDCGGIYVYNWDGVETEISYNLVHDGIVGIYLDNGSANFNVHHNVVWNSQTALRLNSPSTNNLIYNNTLASIRAVSAQLGGGMSGTIIRNNIFGGTVLLDSGATSSSNLMYWTDPRFVDPLTFNFQLLDGSPAIDVGLILPPYTNGYIGTLPDFGGSEYGASPWIAGSSLSTSKPKMPTNLAAVQVTATQANLSWQDNSTNESGYQLERSSNDDLHFALIATLPQNSTSYSDTNLVSGSRYFYRVKATSADDNSAYSNIVSHPSQWLPAPWEGSDIGSVTTAGTHGFQSNPDTSFYGIKSSGAGILDTADACHYMYQPLNGDGQIVALITSNSGTNTNGVSGVMIRESLAPGSKQAALLVGPKSGSIRFVRRQSTGGTSASTTSPSVTIPYWIRLTRSGDVIKAWKSSDRITWSSMGTTTISMGASVYIGLACTSGDTSIANTATFENVMVTPLPDPSKEVVKFTDSFDSYLGWTNIGTTTGKSTLAPDPAISSTTAWYPAMNSDGTSVTSTIVTGMNVNILAGRITTYATVRFDRINGQSANQFVFYLQETGNSRFGELFIRPGTNTILQYFNTQGVITSTYITQLTSQLNPASYQKFAITMIKNADTTMTLIAYVWDGASFLPIGMASGAAYGGGVFNKLGIISANAAGAANRAYLDSIIVTQ